MSYYINEAVDDNVIFPTVLRHLIDFSPQYPVIHLKRHRFLFLIGSIFLPLWWLSSYFLHWCRHLLFWWRSHLRVFAFNCIIHSYKLQITLHYNMWVEINGESRFQTEFTRTRIITNLSDIHIAANERAWKRVARDAIVAELPRCSAYFYIFVWKDKISSSIILKFFLYIVSYILIEFLYFQIYKQNYKKISLMRVPHSSDWRDEGRDCLVCVVTWYREDPDENL